jgi:hypothetical protein
MRNKPGLAGEGVQLLAPHSTLCWIVRKLK